MKKFFSLIAIAMLCVLSVDAQTINIHFKNGQKVQFPDSQVDYVDFTAKPDDPTLTAGDAIDLGLSVKWASCNLGASTPTEAGGYYAWGETSEKSKYTKDNYSYYNATTSSYTNIGTNISGTEYDAAFVNLGKGWSMPSYLQFQELEKKCSWEWTSMNGVNGYIVTGKNGNTIFLPAAGSKLSSVSSKNERGSYWCDYVNNDASANYFNMSSSQHTVENLFTESKYCGLTIRPVYSESKDDGIANIEDYITIARTGNSTTYTSAGVRYTVTFKITNSSTEKIHIVSLGGVDLSEDLAGGKSYEVTLQSASTALQNYKQELIFTYNGKSYSIKG